MATSASASLAWARPLGIHIAAGVSLAHRLRAAPTTSGGRAAALRGVFTERRIARGQLIAVVPARALVTARSAARFLDATALPGATARDALRLASLPSCAALAARSSAGAWFTRDQLLVVTALATWRLSTTRAGAIAATVRWPPFDAYLRVLPRSTPLRHDTAAALAALTALPGDDSANSPDTLVNRFASPLDTRPSPADAMRRRRPLSPAETRSRSDEQLSRHEQPPTRLTVPSSSIAHGAALTSNDHLTRPDEVGGLAAAVAAAARAFAESVAAADGGDDDDAAAALARRATLAEAHAAFSWAHFIVRSRALAPDDSSAAAADDGTRRGAGEARLASAAPQLIPLVDMLNHDMRAANVAVAWNRGASVLGAWVGAAAEPAEVLVSAAADIAPGAEVLLNYAHFAQRGQFMFAPDRGGGGGSDHDGFTPDGEEALPRGREVSPIAAQLLRAQRAAGVTEDEHSWRWQFGFGLPREELQYVREAAWSAALAGRVRRMMDVRRRGRPGEFVVGVPEGLAELRRQRERVERDLYAGRTIFPPQASTV
jgi:hypothetical protein